MTCREKLPTLPILDQPPAIRGGRRLWRSLEELADDETLRRFIEHEFAARAGEWPDAYSRRAFLTLMASSLALAGLSGCSVRPAPPSNLVPYARPAAEVVPGKPLFYATTMTLGGDAVGLLVESHMGRPTKIEGNPDHPASLGATSPLHQASVLELYDPDRSQTVTYLGRERTWDEAAAAMRQATERARDKQGRGLAILSETIVSPTLLDQLARLLDDLPEARWYTHNAIDDEAARSAAQQAFGRAVAPRYDFTQADVVVSLDADFLTAGPGHLRYAHDFIDRRRVRQSTADAAQAEMNRLYVVETVVSCTGAKADHRLPLLASEMERFARTLAARLEATNGQDAPSFAAHDRWIGAVADDLSAHRGRSLVVAGLRQPAVVHLLAHAMNERLENVGKTVRYVDTVAVGQQGANKSLSALTKAMDHGEVECLLVLGGNPAVTAAVDLDFKAALDRVPLRIHLGLYQDETARLCHWHLPQTHYLEAWSDARTFDGTASLVQPLVEPLYQGRSAHEVVALFAQGREVPGRQIVREYWRRKWDQPSETPEFERRWKTALHDGLIAGTAAEAATVSLVDGWQRPLEASSAGDASPTSPTGDLELVLLSDPTIYDGRFANNGWLQELPKPISQLAWGNAAIISPATAERLGLKRGSYAHGGEHGGYQMAVVELRLASRKVAGPVWIMPGVADGAVAVYLGHGRRQAGRVGGNADNTVGFDAYALRTLGQPWFAAGLTLAPTGQTELVACTQQHHSMEGRDPVRAATLEEFRRKPDFVAEETAHERREKTGGVEEPVTFLNGADFEQPKHRWGMSIDLTSCVGCNACIVACQAENNIPIVGKQQVAAGREMHWLRVDRYVSGTADSPEAFHFQPLPCMHCENAPCEYVCPVEATVHSSEGLNDMVYNRCVGTRFCSNNCPYKVRRFNFLAYADFKTESLRLQYNPDVTVRSRGVMEKCTYCVQRIRHAQIDADSEGRSLVDGEIITACQAACPTQAIVFGDMNDSASAVSKLKSSPLHYGLLEDLNTIPRTTYLAELRNPNPQLENA